MQVGFVVGRFQVPELHAGHKSLLDGAVEECDSVVVVLGTSPVRSEDSPLDFLTRGYMFPGFESIDVVPLADCSDDRVWSENLDKLIASILGPRDHAVLYAGRDSFMDVYSGVHSVTQVEEHSGCSGTDDRLAAANRPLDCSKFRAGVIYSQLNQFPKTLPTVDIAISNDDYTELVLVRKPGEDMWRLPGGFVEPGHSLEYTARKEAEEETGLAITGPVYLGSYPINDWRYQGRDKVLTSLFMAKMLSGRLEAADDVEEAEWFCRQGLPLIMPHHVPLVDRAVAAMTTTRVKEMSL